jgi:hypothetical protein
MLARHDQDLCKPGLGYLTRSRFPKYAPKLAILIEELQVKATQGVFCKTVGAGSLTRTNSATRTLGSISGSERRSLALDAGDGPPQIRPEVRGARASGWVRIAS